MWARAARGAEYDDPTDLYSRAIARDGVGAADARPALAQPAVDGARDPFNKQTARGERVLPAYDIWELPHDGSREQQLTTTDSVPIDDITYGLVPIALDADGVRLLAAVTGQSRYDPYAVDLARGRRSASSRRRPRAGRHQPRRLDRADADRRARSDRSATTS